MRHSADWREDADNVAPEERATVADLLLAVGDTIVTRHACAGAIRDRVTVALYGLVHGIVHDWWSIFGRRDGDVSLLKYRSGFLVPDVRMSFDGEAFAIEAKQHRFREAGVRFWGAPAEIMARGDGEEALSALVESVLDRLAVKGLHDTGAQLRWRRVQASRDGDEAAFCEAAGGLGLDPYDISDEAASFIESAEHLLAGEPLIEFVAGAAGVRRAALLNWTEGALSADRACDRLADLRPSADALASSDLRRKGEPAWAMAYRRARSLRRYLGLGQDERFSSFRDLARRFGAARDFGLAPRVDGIRALRSEATDGIRVHLRDQGETASAPAGHLFALARAVGDAACFPEDAVAPINDLRDAYRQAASRAFAAEFLAPSDEIQSMLRDGHDVITIAAEFFVSTAVIERQIENRRRIADSLQPA